MASLLYGYRVGDCNCLLRVPANLNRLTINRAKGVKMAKTDQLARVIAFLLLGYFALSTTPTLLSRSSGRTCAVDHGEYAKLPKLLTMPR
jgi:hypothetical protein